MRSCNTAIAIFATSICSIVCILPGEGRIPVFAPGALTVPGRYFVRGNLSVAAGSVITIASDDLDLDVNGFTLRSTAASPVIESTGASGVTIRNGTLVGASEGIRVDSGERIVVEDLQILGGGPTGTGLLLVGSTQFAIRRVIVRNWGAGILVDSSPLVSAAAAGIIADSLIESCWEGDGIRVNAAGIGSAASVAIQNNRLNGIRGNGITCNWGAGCLIADNTFEWITTHGMALTTYGCRIDDNIVSGPGRFGICQDGDDNLILNNVVARGEMGFFIGGLRNHIEGNVANTNARFGFYIAGTENIYRRNTNRGNCVSLPPACPFGACSLDLCVNVPNSSAGDNYLPGPPCI